MKSVQLPLIALVSVLGFCAYGAPGDEWAISHKLRQTCDESMQNKKGDIVVLGGPAEVLSVINYYKTHKDLCDEKYEHAILSMEKILSQNILGDICSLQSSEAIRDYHLEFIHYYQPGLSDLEIKQNKAVMNDKTFSVVRPIPESLRAFFIVFTKHINGYCRLAIREQLNDLANNENLRIHLEELDYLRQRAKNSMRNLMLAETKTLTGIHKLSLNELQLIESPSTPLYLKEPLGSTVLRMERYCAEVGKPIYDKVFSAVIKLNNLGYIDETISAEDAEFLKKGEAPTKWYEIIQICELVKDIKGTDKDEPRGAAQEASTSTAQTQAPPPPLVRPRELRLRGYNFRHSTKISEKEYVKSEREKFDKFLKSSVLNRTSYSRLIGYDLRLFHRAVVQKAVRHFGNLSSDAVDRLKGLNLYNRQTAVFATVIASLILVISLMKVLS